jgi:hypothetical protein
MLTGSSGEVSGVSDQQLLDRCAAMIRSLPVPDPFDLEQFRINLAITANAACNSSGRELRPPAPAYGSRSQMPTAFLRARHDLAVNGNRIPDLDLARSPREPVGSTGAQSPDGTPQTSPIDRQHRDVPWDNTWTTSGSGSTRGRLRPVHRSGGGGRSAPEGGAASSASAKAPPVRLGAAALHDAHQRRRSNAADLARKSRASTCLGQVVCGRGGRT